MKNVLLISPADIKAQSVVDDNLNEKVLAQAILEAQHLGLEEFIGTALLEKIQSLVEEGTIEDEPTYKNLLDDYIFFYLLYQVLSDIAIPISYKVANAGITQVEDVKLVKSSMNEIDQLKDYYNHRANAWKDRIQRFLIKHRSSFPELKHSSLDEEHSQLYSSSNCPIWLGGARAKRR